MISYVIGNNKDEMLKFLREQGKPFVAIGAVFGNEQITLDDGAILAASGGTSPSPALLASSIPAVVKPDELIVAMSHVDLPVLLGCLAIENRKPGHLAEFYNLVAHVANRGIHRIHICQVFQTYITMLCGFQAWRDTHRIVPRISKTPEDVTVMIKGALDVVEKILMFDKGFLELGQVFERNLSQLNESSFLSVDKDSLLIERSAPVYVNHLFASPFGLVTEAKCIVSIKTGVYEVDGTGRISVSLVEPIHGISCKDLMQHRFGQRATGDDVRAISPYGERKTFDDVASVVTIMRNILSNRIRLPLAIKVA